MEGGGWCGKRREGIGRGDAPAAPRRTRMGGRTSPSSTPQGPCATRARRERNASAGRLRQRSLSLSLNDEAALISRARQRRHRPDASHARPRQRERPRGHRVGAHARRRDRHLLPARGAESARRGQGSSNSRGNKFEMGCPGGKPHHRSPVFEFVEQQPAADGHAQLAGREGPAPGAAVPREQIRVAACAPPHHAADAALRRKAERHASSRHGGRAKRCGGHRGRGRSAARTGVADPRARGGGRPSRMSSASCAVCGLSAGSGSCGHRVRERIDQGRRSVRQRGGSVRRGKEAPRGQPGAPGAPR